MEWNPYLWLVGLVIGVMVGLTGTGGGSLATPLLILLGIRPSVAVGTTLVQMAVTKALGAWQHWRQGTADLGIALTLALGSVPGALVGTHLLGRWAGSVDLDAFLRRFLGLMLILTALSILMGIRRFPWHGRLTGLRGRALAVGVGFVLGALVAWTSVGSGALFLGLMVAFVPAPIPYLVGTDVLHGFLLTVAAGAGHLLLGTVDLLLALNLLVGSLPGVFLGAWLARRAPEGRLRTLVGVVMLALGVRLL